MYLGGCHRNQSQRIIIGGSLKVSHPFLCSMHDLLNESMVNNSEKWLAYPLFPSSVPSLCMLHYQRDLLKNFPKYLIGICCNESFTHLDLFPVLGNNMLPLTSWSNFRCFDLNVLLKVVHVIFAVSNCLNLRELSMGRSLYSFQWGIWNSFQNYCKLFWGALTEEGATKNLKINKYKSCMFFPMWKCFL